MLPQIAYSFFVVVFSLSAWLFAGANQGKAKQKKDRSNNQKNKPSSGEAEGASKTREANGVPKGGKIVTQGRSFPEVPLNDVFPTQQKKKFQPKKKVTGDTTKAQSAENDVHHTVSKGIEAEKALDPNTVLRKSISMDKVTAKETKEEKKESLADPAEKKDRVQLTRSTSRSGATDKQKRSHKKEKEPEETPPEKVAEVVAPAVHQTPGLTAVSCSPSTGVGKTATASPKEKSDDRKPSISPQPEVEDFSAIGFFDSKTLEVTQVIEEIRDAIQATPAQVQKDEIVECEDKEKKKQESEKAEEKKESRTVGVGGLSKEIVIEDEKTEFENRAEKPVRARMKNRQRDSVDQEKQKEEKEKGAKDKTEFESVNGKARPAHPKMKTHKSGRSSSGRLAKSDPEVLPVAPES
ncbi:hypothetical protein L596_019012 [Steinernema carpocapsae]|uniref:Uncharacterized protein n=1 Tax=Steinernema carpocapsae TaxID=34508 RepID=A0A4U5N6K1_STECR|nr:hypothetical protein L596_019012 [Steinernema carpocapsae]